MMSKIMNGTDLPTLMRASNMANNELFAKIRPLPVKNAKNPRGKPTSTDMAVEASPM